MKKLVTVFLFSIGLLVVSCQKEDIKPNAIGANSDSPTSVYKNRSGGTVIGGNGTVVTGGTNPNGGEITDPNNDPDGNKKNNNK